MTTLNEWEINQIVNATSRDPHGVLGIHKINEKDFSIRAYNPAVKKIEIIFNELESPIEMDRITEDGLFEKKVELEDFAKYKFKYTGHNGVEWERYDAYSFLPSITEYDMYLFNEGNHHRIYEKLGAHIKEIDGVKGVSFGVWAPEAERVSVVGHFNSWDGRVNQMRILGNSGVWELFIPNIGEGELYRFEIKTKNNDILLKSDPYAFYSEVRPDNASVVYEIDNKYDWNDDKWLKNRREKDQLNSPMSTYEVHLGSWARKVEEENRVLTYREMADLLVNYVSENNFTHVEFMPILEHPLDESWGYQVTGYFSTTSRFGKPEDLMYLIDKFHEKNIGVILDWVPGHFPKDVHGLGRFDGTALYEHADPRQGEHKDWGTYIFNYGRNEVKNFLISNALYWFDKFHFDGVRVDAVASMLYLDYSREADEWVPNKFGGRENLEAIEFLQYFNSISHEYYPGIVTIAEESTDWQGVSKPTYLGGLGFSMKWNMGWMNDTLEYIEKNPIFRRYHQNSLTFSLVYAFSENFILVLSHDEVVHGKKSMLDKMPGEYWEKFANLRLFYSYMYAHPGKKLIFMGGEFGQWKEWNCKQSLDWDLLEYAPHNNLKNFIKDLNGVYKENNGLWENDFSGEGFEWIDFNDADNSVISFVRKGNNPDERIVCVFNFTPMVRYGYRLGVPDEGYYEEILNSDSENYFGSNNGNYGGVWSEQIPWQGKGYSIDITLPPLAGVYFKLKK
ncbi:1,4-alpha-glucan branching protein GlgB [Haliovirga abyssi]|uniref:1,4-alpha-glucan branching enzyme GlgB n=1 Tax=Haliovirga abyssi TaxID=2996794 RepID=A0AAU9E2M0_9FUSO|nr:1,4-alpha-glucan branching protein GlgB [Haliovirga abyssi]BDU50640.1 1,4-alpha-glucan branching enzyme GlgB [Haliovirga abyssi]